MKEGVVKRPVDPVPLPSKCVSDFLTKSFQIRRNHFFWKYVQFVWGSSVFPFPSLSTREFFLHSSGIATSLCCYRRSYL